MTSLSHRSARLLAGGAAAVTAGAAGLLGLRRRRRRSATGAGFGLPAGAGAGSTQAEQHWTCACGAEYRVAGIGRHRVFWPADGAEDDAIMSGECPSCGRPLKT